MFHIMKTCLLAAMATAAAASTLRAEIVTTNCGTPIQSSVMTGNEPFKTTSKEFIRIRGAVFIVDVPAGQRRCVKVRFTAGAICRAVGGNPACFIRIAAEGTQMHPQAGPNQGFSGQPFNPGGLGYQWVQRFGPGSHLIQIQVRTDNVPETIVLAVNDWTMDVEVLNSAP
jgi:hypothetical protein